MVAGSAVNTRGSVGIAVYCLVGFANSASDNRTDCIRSTSFREFTLNVSELTDYALNVRRKVAMYFMYLK